jgi:hypothetical protein
MPIGALRAVLGMPEEWFVPSIGSDLKSVRVAIWDEQKQGLS